MEPKIDLRGSLTAKLPLFVFCLFILQPLMDVLSYWIGRLGMSNAPTLVLRLCVLGLTVVLGFSLSHRKRVYFIAAGVMAVIGLGHMLAAFQCGYQSLLSDLTNLIRCLQMPVTALCLITFFRENEDSYEAMKKGAVACLVIIMAVEVLSVATGTELHTYTEGRGYIGWFSNTNSQSAILSMLCPVAAAWLYQKKGLKSPLFWVLTLGSFSAMYFLGPRLSYLGLMAAGCGLGLSVILIRPADWKRSLAFFGMCLLFLAVISRSPMFVHQQEYNDFQTERQSWIDWDVRDKLPPSPPPKSPEEGPMTDEEIEQEKEQKKTTVEVLTPIYETYVPDFVEIFGVERTMEMFDYTKDVYKLTATRPKKLMFAELLMDSSPLATHLFGIELARFTVNGNVYDVENDFHGIYYLYGWVGLGALLAFLGYFVVLIFWALFKNFRQYFTLEAAALGIAFVMCMIHAYNTAGVLRRPNASFYLSAVLAGIYYLVRIKRYGAPADALTEKG